MLHFLFCFPRLTSKSHFHTRAKTIMPAENLNKRVKFYPFALCQFAFIFNVSFSLFKNIPDHFPNFSTNKQWMYVFCVVWYLYTQSEYTACCRAVLDWHYLHDFNNTKNWECILLWMNGFMRLKSSIILCFLLLLKALCIHRIFDIAVKNANFPEKVTNRRFVWIEKWETVTGAHRFSNRNSQTMHILTYSIASSTGGIRFYYVYPFPPAFRPNVFYLSCPYLFISKNLLNWSIDEFKNSYGYAVMIQLLASQNNVYLTP